MAKSRAPVSTLDQIRSLLTAAEQKVLASSMGATIAKATKEQTEAAMKRARVLRDKWRDLHAAQARSTKRTPKAGSDTNERTKAKHDVFDGAVKRLESRLAELAAGVKSAVGKQAARLGAAAKPTKASRTKAARDGRASVRSELKTAVTAMNRTVKPAASKAVVASPSKPAAAATKASAGKPTVVASGTGASKKRKKPAAPKAAAAQGRVAFDAAKQRSAKASAMAARLKFDGATTRRAGSVLANTKRAQARRDGRRR